LSFDRQPVLFLGHGSPMNVIQDSGFRRAWQSLGHQFGQRWTKPKLILCISAHWITEGWWLTGMAQPRTIHDFGGFPDALFAQQYPAPGAPQWAAEVAQRLQQPHNAAPIGLDMQAWGLDHGCWSVLKPMFPAADIPVVQLSVDYHQPPEAHYALGQQLQPLRDEGVLIVASGNTVHNLRALHRDAPEGQTYDWAKEFDDWVAAQIQDNNGHSSQRQRLTRFRELGAIAQMAHPSWDHFLPLLYAAGAAKDEDRVSFFNDSHQLASIAMRCVIWDGA
jgi:4,5-DOPA dioxygenase extradiol